MEIITELMVLLIVVAGLVMVISSLFGGRMGGRIFRFGGGILAVVICVAIFADPLLSFIGGIVSFVVTWLIRILAVAFVVGVIYLIIRFFRSR